VAGANTIVVDALRGRREGENNLEHFSHIVHGSWSLEQ
jgi:hypothetical protein